MTFDVAIEKIESITDDLNIRQEVINDIVSVIEQLRQEYAPTIEMTQEQHDLIFDARYNDRDKLYEVMGTDDGYYFHAEYWGNLEPHDVASAYLHPETIKIVDE